MAMTAKPIIDASSTRHPNCSRIGIRILTITLRPRARLQVSRAREDVGAEPRGTAAISQLRYAGAEEGAKRGGCGAWRVFLSPFPVASVVVKRSFRSWWNEASGESDGAIPRCNAWTVR